MESEGATDIGNTVNVYIHMLYISTQFAFLKYIQKYVPCENKFDYTTCSQIC